MIDEDLLTDQVMTAPKTNTWVYDFHQHHAKQVHYALNELKPHDVRVQVLYSAISLNDLTYIKGTHKHDWFGSEVIGRIVAVGKESNRKAGETVGVAFQNQDAKSHSGFTQYLQIDESHLVDIPAGLAIEKSASLLSTGVFAFNALDKLRKGTHVAIIGHGNLAFLAVQFAKKQFGFEVTLFAPADQQGLAKEFGADHFEVRSVENFNKKSQKFPSVIFADILEEAEVKPAMATLECGGRLVIAVSQPQDLNVSIMDLVVNQKQLFGVKRSKRDQHAKVLSAALLHGICPSTEVFEFKKFDQALQAAAKSTTHSIVVHVA